MKKTFAILLATILVAATAALCVSVDAFGDVTVNCGTWVLDNGTYKSGTAANGDNLLNTGIKVESGKHILVSVDVKYDEFQGACGVGLHFSTNKDGGVADGMGLLTWTASDFQQFKTWGWNPAIASVDWWNPVDDLLAWNDTTTVYTISAEFIGDGNIIYSIKNNANGKSFVLGSPQEKAFDFIFPSNGYVYVNLINLNCAASFSNLVVNDMSSPATADMTAAIAIVAAVTTTAGCAIVIRKRG